MMPGKRSKGNLDPSRAVALDAGGTVRLLAIAMIEPSFRALLVASVGAPPLPAASLLAALGAAVAMSAIAVRHTEKNTLGSL